MNILKYLLIVFSLITSSAATADGLVIVYGDSLTAGYNLPAHAAFPNQLDAWLENQGWQGTVINASQSGDTTAVGLARYDWAMANLSQKPNLFILELGANDMLRGIEPGVARSNLDALLERVAKDNIPVLIAGMQATPSYGEEWAHEFNSIYPELAEKYDAALYPFFLDGVAMIPELNLDDGIHPTEEGVAVIVERIGPMVLNLLQGEG